MRKRCFIISPFGHPFDDYHKKIFQPAISDAGMEAFRGDDIYGVRPIIQDIWDSIRESDIVLADLTTKNPNVFYELGIAHSYQKPVILLSRTQDDLPFDLRHHRIILYDTSKASWAKDLGHRISKTIKVFLTSKSLPKDYFSVNIGDYSTLGIIKFTSSSADRISDYKLCLQDARGECFITGTSMVHLADDSSDILFSKLPTTNFKLLIMSPDWILAQRDRLAFLPEAKMRESFYIEIENSISKLRLLRSRAPKGQRAKMKMRTYSTFFPHIITGYEYKDEGKMVVEITDYLPEHTRPRLTIKKMKDDQCPFFQIRRKFESLWNSALTRDIT